MKHPFVASRLNRPSVHAPCKLQPGYVLASIVWYKGSVAAMVDVKDAPLVIMTWDMLLVKSGKSELVVVGIGGLPYGVESEDAELS